MALTQMAIFRRATLDKDTLSLYSKRLEQENVEDVVRALEKIQETPRKECESALPDIGSILASVKTETAVRNASASRGQQLVAWHCPACGHTMTDFLTSGAALKRVCRRKLHQREAICGADMAWQVFEEGN